MTDNQTFIFIRWRRFPSFFRTCAIRWLTHFSNQPFVLTPALRAIHKQLIIKCLYIGSGAGGTERGAGKTGNHGKQHRKAPQVIQEMAQVIQEMAQVIQEMAQVIQEMAQVGQEVAQVGQREAQAKQETTASNTGNGAGGTINGAGAIFSG